MAAKSVTPATNPATAGQLLTMTVDSTNVAPTALLGWSFTESTGSAGASVRLHDGQNSAAPSLCSAVKLSAGESTRDWFGDQTIEIFSGSVFLEVLSGSVECVVWLA